MEVLWVKIDCLGKKKATPAPASESTAGAMALSYDEGMAALRGMFPTWDADLLAELLEANDGHLENTIDMALSMEPPAPGDDSAASAPTPAAPARPPPAPVAPTRGANRVKLPDDFLRLPGESSGGAGLSEQEQRDAELARMLQDEIFRQELMESEEFSSHFQGDRQRGASRAYPPEKSATEIANETLAVMSEKFTSMSEGGCWAFGCLLRARGLLLTAVGDALSALSALSAAVMKKKMHEMYLRFQTRSDAPSGSDPYRCALLHLCMG